MLSLKIWTRPFGPLGATLRRVISNANTVCFRRCIATSPCVTSLATQPIKRFYKDVEVVKVKEEGSEVGYQIKLDERNLRTPSRKVFKVYNQALAYAIAEEWNAQETMIQQASMHLTSLSNTAQDNPLNKSKSDYCGDILNIFYQDTLLYQAEKDSQLWELQGQKWGALLNWFQDEFQVNLGVSIGGFDEPKISPDDKTKVGNFLQNHSFESLIGLSFATSSVTSLILPIAVSKGKLDSKEAVQLSRLETTFQTSKWGTVEWAHELEFHDTVARFSAGMLFYDLYTNPVTPI